MADDPTFFFPPRVRLLRQKGWLGHAVADPNGEAVKDDAGEIILMAFYRQRPGAAMWIVAHDKPSSVYPAQKYLYQRYTETKTDDR